MTNTTKIIFLMSACLISIFSGISALAYQNPIVNAGSDLYVTSGQTTALQTTAYDPNGFTLNYYWSCNGGTLSNYNIVQPIYTAPTNSYNYQTSYVCTLTATNTYGNSTADSVTIYVNYYNNGNNTLSVGKKIIDITSGNINWSTSINANPSDILTIAVTLQTTGQDAHNVIVRDIMPANLIYKGNLMVNTSNYAGDITSGINIGTVYANQPIVVSYQTQVASAENFNYGINSINSSTSVTSTESGTQTSLATITVNKSLVYGVSTISTGLTNNIIFDSFFVPLLLIILMAWFYFSGIAYKLANWLKSKT